VTEEFSMFLFYMEILEGLVLKCQVILTALFFPFGVYLCVSYFSSNIQLIKYFSIS
jgi:hypothetical protein